MYGTAVARKQQTSEGQGRIAHVAAAWEKHVYEKKINKTICVLNLINTVNCVICFPIWEYYGK